MRPLASCLLGRSVSFSFLKSPKKLFASFMCCMASLSDSLFLALPSLALSSSAAYRVMGSSINVRNIWHF